MKTPDKTTPTTKPKGPPPPPSLDPKTSQRVPPHRGRKSVRTICFHQPAPTKDRVDCFSATGVYVESLSTADAELIVTQCAKRKAQEATGVITERENIERVRAKRAATTKPATT